MHFLRVQFYPVNKGVDNAKDFFSIIYLNFITLLSSISDN